MHPLTHKHPLTAWFQGLVIVAVMLISLFGGSAQAASSSYTIPNNTPGFINKAVDQGPVDPSTVITVTAWLKLHNVNQLDQLVGQQTQKGSSNYHRWLTQAQFDASFSPTSQQVNAVKNFLTAHNFKVLAVAENNAYVKVQGTVGHVEKVFHVQIDNFKFNGLTYRSNTGNPSINDPSGGNIAAITGLDNYGFQPQYAFPAGPEGVDSPMTPISSSPNGLFFESQCFRTPETHAFSGTGVSATYSGNRYGSDITGGMGHLPPCGYQPGELQTAYNMTSLYAAGLDGSGETVVIVDAYGSATIAQDAEAFSQIYGLPDLTSANFQIVKAPGLVNNPFGPTRNWALETTLDVEWAHAMAPGANIALVLATDYASLDEAINYAVIHHLGNTISNSWGTVEGLGNPAQFKRDNRILEMAAAEGVDVNFASGDWGDDSPSWAAGFVSVDFPASSPFATGIGGTSLALNPDNSMAFQTGWGNNITRIADVAPGNVPMDPPLSLGFNGGAGGGSSVRFAKPSFQSGLPGTMRQVPDVSMLADPFTGAEFIETFDGVMSVGVIGGTSLAAPMFSAVMAIAAQKNGHEGLGQAAPLMYSLPAGAITDVTAFSSPNNVTGSITDSHGTTSYSADQLAAPLVNTTGYFSAFYNSPFTTRWFVLTFGTDTGLVTGPGWDNVTGVGTPNGASFINALVP